MSEPVPFFSAQRIHEGFDALAAVRRVLDRHWYVLGEEVKAFERDFAAYCGVAHCISLANGTDALELALRALGIGPGDPVVLAGNAGYYGATAVALVGARPCFVDVDARTLTLSPQALQQALAQGLRPKAVLVTHLYGQLADIEALSTLCSQNGIALVEDCAQAHGARRGGQLAGSWGDIACFSFYPTKNLGALGDGGAMATGREDLAQRVRALRQYGWSQKYHNTLALGRNSRLDEIQAAVLNDKLPLLDAANQARQALAARYNAAFQGLPLTLPCSVGEDFVAHLYVVRTPVRDALRAHLTAAGIATDVHYPVPDSQQAACPAGSAIQPLPVTEQACQTVLSLPCYPGMPGSDAERVIAGVRSFMSTQGS